MSEGETNYKKLFLERGREKVFQKEKNEKEERERKNERKKEKKMQKVGWRERKSGWMREE